MTHLFQKGQEPHNAGERRAAKLAGQKRYFTGIPCVNGHISERSTTNGCCLVCSKEKQSLFRKSRTEEKKQLDLEVAKKRSAEWRKDNPDKVKAQSASKAAYKAANPHKSAALLAKRRAAKKQRTPPWLNSDQLWMIEEAYELAAMRSTITGFVWHVDHICPLQGKEVSGLHVPWNLQVIPWRDNVSKGNKLLPHDKIPPKAKSPLAYLKEVK
jgi:hypothetical protein